MKISVIRGDTTNIKLTITDQDATAINLNGAVVFFTVKSDPFAADDDALIAKEITSHTTAASGITTVALSATDTTIAAGVYYYDVQVRNSTGTIQSIDQDIFEVKQDITVRVA
jgi:hypothetical protein